MYVINVGKKQKNAINKKIYIYLRHENRDDNHIKKGVRIFTAIGTPTARKNIEFFMRHLFLTNTRVPAPAKRSLTCLLVNLFTCLLVYSSTLLPLMAQNVWVEAENFVQKGGWIIDPQFMDQMGSPYLMAHGKGQPVIDATTTVLFASTGVYHVYVRTYNWTSPWSKAEGPGKFQVIINGTALSPVLGSVGDAWMWQSAGTVTISKEQSTVALHDLTGFNGRCDALFFTKETAPPPASPAELAAFRYQQNPVVTQDGGSYDLVVVGGGIAGICAAVSAARSGLQVALIHNRSVWGGNNSSDVRVHLGGRVNINPYPQLGAIVSELSPSGGGNAQPAATYEDNKKKNLIETQAGLTPFLNLHVYAVVMEGNKIQSVKAKHTQTGEEFIFHAPLFADCTGDGMIGVLAGANYLTGTESKAEYGEPHAPANHSDLTMGSSVQWYALDRKTAMPFPEFEYGISFDEQSVRKTTRGDWDWETGMDLDQVEEFERIRDYGMLVIYSNWSFLKNHSTAKNTYVNHELDWVAAVAGKRESKRLVGDIVLTEQDVRNQVVYPDGTATTSWSIDLHYPNNAGGFSGTPFLSVANQSLIYGYPIPYRCLYSKDVDNLFMAGRNISVTHIVLGSMRVMRTTGMLGEVVGMAASICKRHQAKPRAVYEQYLSELKLRMMQGVGIDTDVVKKYPKYNLGEWHGNLWEEETEIPIEDHY
jgi:hypothetical protein